jgi:hypothetical protein
MASRSVKEILNELDVSVETNKQLIEELREILGIENESDKVDNGPELDMDELRDIFKEPWPTYPFHGHPWPILPHSPSIGDPAPYWPSSDSPIYCCSSCTVQFHD